jgi:hypothetical protein
MEIIALSIEIGKNAADVLVVACLCTMGVFVIKYM